MTIARIEVFRTGSFTPMEGPTLTFSAADLRAVADSYDPETAPAPIVVGHPSADAPAFGWVQSYEFDATADRLYANIGEMEPAFAEAVKAGRYKKVSQSFFKPDHPANPAPGTWYPKHVGFLGAAAPAVPGLRNVHFSAGHDGAVTISADFGVGRDTAGLFRGLRDFLIEKFGLEDADRVLPAYSIEWLAEEHDPVPVARRSFAAAPDPVPETPPVIIEDKQPMSNTGNTEFSEREARVAEREAAIAARERESRHQAHASFAEALVNDGRLLPASAGQVVGLLDDLAAADTASFSAEAGDPAERLRAILKAQPKVVQFGAASLGEDGTAPAASFAADGKPVANADVHAKALAWQAQHPETSFIDAVKAVSAEA